MSLAQLLQLLTALNQVYQSAHWTSKGGLFYSTHLLFERLYNSVNEERDDIAELALASDEPEDSFYPEAIFKGALQFCQALPKTNSERVKFAIRLEEQVLELVKELSTKKYKDDIAAVNLLAGIAETHKRSNLYLLKQNLKA